MITKKKTEHRSRLKRHIRIRITGTTERPRLTVFKSLRNVYAQIIDDSSGKTIIAVSNMSKDVRDQFKDLKGQAAKAKLVGKLAAAKALEQHINQVVFDRNGYLYHGVIKAMADGAREGGLKF
jgi:large subunit ribosomal protein L18